MLRLRVTVLLTGIFLAIGFSSPIFADALLSINPVTTTVDTGTTFVVNVNISGVVDLYAYQFDIDFNPAVIQATSVIEGSFLPNGGATFFVPGAIDNTNGEINFSADTLLSATTGVSGGGTLLQLDFKAIAPGTSAIVLPNNIDLILQDSTSALISSTQANGSVTVQGSVTGVPEPSGLSQILMGLICVALVGLRKGIPHSS
jgi:hypothetical protein